MVTPFEENDNMKLTTLPSLDDSGWINNTESPLMMANAMFSHFFASDYSQTHIYLKQVSSFAWIIDEYKGNIEATVKGLQAALVKYFSRYFSGVDCEVENISGDLLGKVELTIRLEFKDGTGKTQSLHKAIRATNGKAQKIINLNNYGTNTL